MNRDSTGLHARRGKVATSRPLTLFAPTHERSVFLRYGFALLFTGIALAITLVFPQPHARPYYFLVAGIALATWYGGSWPGLLSTLLSTVLGFVFVFLPGLQHAPTIPDAIRYLGFVTVCLVVYGLAAALYRAARELHKAHLYFGGVVEISEDAIMTINEEQKITLFNPGAEKIFGYRTEEVLGRSINLLLPDRYRSIHEQHVRAFSESHDVLRAMNERGVIFGRRADGTEFPAEASISKFEANGEKVMTVRLRDVTERRATEQRLRQMAAIVESSQDAIISEDVAGVITSWNPGAERMYGYTAPEAIGRNARILLPPGNNHGIAANVERARQGLGSTEESVRMRKDGQQIDVALTVSPIRDQHGNVAGVATIARDITERKRLEDQLRHSQKMEAVGRLAGGMAHDFNNLLSIIVGYTYLVQSNTAEGEPLRNAADEIMAASERASTLTRQLLAFSRKQVMRPEVLELNEITSGIGKILPRLLGEDIDLRIYPGEDLLNIKADPGQIEQVIMNLVVNARDAMPHGGKLTIETANVVFDETKARHHGVAPGNYVMLAVSDTGHGMDAETRAHIFEPFFTTKEAGKGTGLGLATVYGIVSQSNGHIWVYSEPGRGTTFKIYFPATQAFARPHVAQRPEPVLCGSETILLVEDEEGLRELLARVLRDKGYKVLAASNGPEALRLVQEHDSHIELLLTDVVMPDMRGQQLAAELISSKPDLAVIYMSGYTDNALTHAGSLPPGTTFLQKPFTPEVVLRRVREVLDEAAAQRRPSARPRAV
ncbi:MAG: PAS domain S-box protein [Terriglobales bacterium]